MKNPLLLIIFGSIVVLSLGTYVLSQNYSQSDRMIKNDDSISPNEEMIDEEIMPNASETVDHLMTNGAYIPYSSTALETSENNRRVLFFYASWCPTCKPADASFSQNISKIPPDVTVIRVNYNDPETDQAEKELAKKYGITYQHTFVQIDNAGNEVTKWNGGQINELLSNIKWSRVINI